VGHFGPYGGTVRTMGLDSSVLRSEVSFGHFGTCAKMSLWTHLNSTKVSQCRSVLCPKCLGTIDCFLLFLLYIICILILLSLFLNPSFVCNCLFNCKIQSRSSDITRLDQLPFSILLHCFVLLTLRLMGCQLGMLTSLDFFLDPRERNFLTSENPRLTRPPDNRPTVSGIIVTGRPCLLSIDRSLVASRQP